MAIIVKTQAGTGGGWVTVFSAKTGPTNLLHAVREAQNELAINAQVGGYRTVITIDGKILDPLTTGWPITLAEARSVLAE